MLIIPVLFYVLFCYWPMYGVQIAFKKYNVRMGIEGSPWVGFKYFEKYLTDPYFWKVVRNTLLLNIYSLVFSFPAPIILALMLNELRSSVYKKAVQTVSYLPHFISTVVVCGMVVNFLSNSGPINDVIESLGGERIQFMMEAKYFRTIYIASGIWQNIGWNSIIYFAAISAVDPSLYEAALMDGAGRFKQVIHVTIPAMMPSSWVSARSPSGRRCRIRSVRAPSASARSTTPPRPADFSLGCMACPTSVGQAILPLMGYYDGVKKEIINSRGIIEGYYSREIMRTGSESCGKKTPIRNIAQPHCLLLRHCSAPLLVILFLRL